MALGRSRQAVPSDVDLLESWMIRFLVCSDFLLLYTGSESGGELAAFPPILPLFTVRSSYIPFLILPHTASVHKNEVSSDLIKLLSGGGGHTI